MEADIVLATQAAVAGWFDRDGCHSSLDPRTWLTSTSLDAWLSQWKLSRSVPLRRRSGLLNFLLNDAAPSTTVAHLSDF
jgi:hypothetical protein